MRARRTDQCAGVAGPRRASVVGLRAAPYTMDDTNKLVPQGRDQVAKLPILERTETHNFGRSHQSPVRIFTSTVNSALSSSTSIKVLQYI